MKDAKPQRATLTACLAAWLAALDTQELNDRFYAALRKWFKRAVDAKDTKFPRNKRGGEAGAGRTRYPVDHPSPVRLVRQGKGPGRGRSVHRGTGRLRCLKDYDRASGDSYYRAVLQNLFFATLNTEIRPSQIQQDAPTTRTAIFSRYRYKDEMSRSLHAAPRVARPITVHQRRAVRLPGQRGSHSATAARGPIAFPTTPGTATCCPYPIGCSLESRRG